MNISTARRLKVSTPREFALYNIGKLQGIGTGITTGFHRGFISGILVGILTMMLVMVLMVRF